MSTRPIYLDNHATTCCDPRVLDAMLPYFCDRYGNASSISHEFGWEAKDAVATAREHVAGLTGAEPRDVVFTSGATEANNLAIKGLLLRSLTDRRSETSNLIPHVITNVAEHRAVLDPVKKLERLGVAADILPVDATGRVREADIEQAVRPETLLVSVMIANNEIGTVNPVRAIAEICHGRGVVLHCDAVQAAGRIPVGIDDLQADLLSLSGHKLYGPKGIGALIVRRRLRRSLDAQIDGGGHEGHLRSGTLPVPLVVGFGEACRLARAELETDRVRIRELRDRLWQGLASQLDGLHLNGHPTERLPGNLNVSFEGIDGDVLMNAMTKIAVSSGSACTSSNPEPSHVLKAIGRDDRLTRASLRFGIGRFNTEAEIETAIEFVVSTVRRLR